MVATCTKLVQTTTGWFYPVGFAMDHIAGYVASRTGRGVAGRWCKRRTPLLGSASQNPHLLDETPL